ncbi:rRNA methyltransferase 2, mitochondrial [Phytophthora boehmeriae]|uniref:rRNA methyltransferase 2, mitochondrial n=1 Tax=Phytophthora boehmeriae TaxID=109152 RepID=A0A8T1WXM1_9STRA|nr:rRNA methyltransferase 2, mitochondrial [Phytophthora boehmeriae]
MSGLYTRSTPLVRCCPAPLRAFKSLKGKSNASARWRFQLLRRGDVVLDLGAAPGGWTQVAVEATAPKKKPKNGQEPPPRVVALDLKHFDPVEGAAIVVGDFRQAKVRAQLDELLGGRKANVVLSDMAPSFSGNFLTDSQQQLRLCHNALKMAELYLRPGGNFATKILRCDGSEEFRADLKAAFDVVKAMKPQSSRPESTEMFLVAKGFKGVEPLAEPGADSGENGDKQ